MWFVNPIKRYKNIFKLKCSFQISDIYIYKEIQRNLYRIKMYFLEMCEMFSNIVFSNINYESVYILNIEK